MKITDYLREHGLEAKTSYNEAAIKVYHGTELAYELQGSKLAEDMTHEGTFKYVKECTEAWLTKREEELSQEKL